MTQLGSVVGTVLAELTRARVVADQVTRDLVAAYEDDPVLAAMNVPRVTLGEATITVRYAVEDLVEPPSSQPDLAWAKGEWVGVVETKVLPAVAGRLGLAGEDADQMIRSLRPTLRPPSVNQLRAALSGNGDAAVKPTVESVVSSWGDLATSDRRRIGRKTDFRSAFEDEVRSEFARFSRDIQRRALLDAVLASRLEVSVTRDRLPDDPGRIQELTLSIRAEDLDLVLAEED